MSESRNQFLTFILEKENFGIDVFQVREILEYTKCTRVPNSAEFIRGVINLRGSIVPVLDLRLKFGLPPTESTVDTCIIIVEIEMKGETILLGALADSVREVLEIEESEIEPPPKLGTKAKTGFIKGMCKKNDQIIMILNANMLFSNEEIIEFESLTSSKASP